MTTTLTLLHGFMGDPADWDELSAGLPEYQIVTPKIRPAENWQDGVAELLAELPERSVLVGYSMGARLALACAVESPHQFEALVFISGNPGLPDTVSRNDRYQHDLQVATLLEDEPREEFLKRWYSQIVFETLDPVLAQAEIERKLSQDGRDWSDILRTYSLGQQPDYWPSVGDLPFPILAVAGQRDSRYVDIVVGMSQLSNCEARVIPACGHILHREQPYVFLHVLREFLQSISKQPTPCPQG